MRIQCQALPFLNRCQSTPGQRCSAEAMRTEGRQGNEGNSRERTFCSPNFSAPSGAPGEAWLILLIERY